MSTISFRRLHRFSGLTLAVFTFIHLLNHLIGLGGEDLYTPFMKAARLLYRNPVVETLLLVAVLIQIYSGINMIWKKGKLTSMSRAERIRIYSGLYLAFFLIVHLFVILFYRGQGIDTNFYFACLGFNIFPVILIFIPYYGAGILSVFVHLGIVHYFKMQRYVSIAKARKQALGIIMAGCIITFLIFLSYTNYFRGVPLNKEHMNLARHLFKAFM